MFRPENTIFLPILANLGHFVANLRTFGVLFQAYILWWCTKIDKYEVCILLAQARHNTWQRHPQVKRVQSQDANLPAAMRRGNAHSPCVTPNTLMSVTFIAPQAFISQFQVSPNVHFTNTITAQPRTHSCIPKHRFRSECKNYFALIVKLFNLKIFSGRCPKSSFSNILLIDLVNLFKCQHLQCICHRSSAENL